MDNRREFLKKAALLAGGTGLLGNLPASIKKALSINPNQGTTFADAEHVVFLMQENRSFDHCFGTLRGVRGFNDPRAITIPGQLPVWIQTNHEGKKYVPFRLNMKDTRATWMGGLPHSWPDQVDARNNGKYDRWLDAKRAGGDYKDMPLTLGYYTREDIPFYYALADAFTICDQNFSSSLTGTTANRSFFWSGTIREKPGEPANVLNSDTYYNREAHWTTYPERLEEAGVSWRIYQNELSVQTEVAGNDASWLANFTDNNLEWFANFKVRFHKAHRDFMHKRMKELPGEIKALKKNLKGALQNEAAGLEKQLKQKTEQLEKYRRETETWSEEKFEQLSDFEKNIHQKAFTTNVNDPHYHQTDPFTYEDNGIEREFRLPKGDILHQFRYDVNNGQLPAVSWLVAPQYFSDHPSAPWFGAWYVSEVLEILTKNPEVWKKTIFILNYDENDGYFDHIPPFTAPYPTDKESGMVSKGIDTADEFVTMEEELRHENKRGSSARESPIGLGYRVPLIIASPWTRGGWVNSQVFDITSTIRFLEVFLEKKTGEKIIESNISNWRRTVTGDLTSVFRPYNGERIELPDFIERDSFITSIYKSRHRQPPDGYRSLTDSEIINIRDTPFSRHMPGQEEGTKKSCALPYDLAADGRLSKDRKRFLIGLEARNTMLAQPSVGAPFYIYAPGKYFNGQEFEEVRVWNFAVKAGDAVRYDFPIRNFENGSYHLRVYGPNGFFREFSGFEDDPDVDVWISYEKDDAGVYTGNIFLSMSNISKEPLIFSEKQNCYPGGTTMNFMKPGKSINRIINLSESFGWYDFTIKITKPSSFIPACVKRYAGRIETGQHSFSDPYMGLDLK